MVLNRRINIWSVILSIILIGIINLIPSKNFFGAYYVDLYILFPLLLFQLVTLLFSVKYGKLSLFVSISVNLIIMFILYKFVVNF